GQRRLQERRKVPAPVVVDGHDADGRMSAVAGDVHESSRAGGGHRRSAGIARRMRRGKVHGHARWRRVGSLDEYVPMLPEAVASARRHQVISRLAGLPVVLVTTILAIVPIVYLTARPGFTRPILDRWILPEDLHEIATYCLVVTVLLAILI